MDDQPSQQRQRPQRKTSGAGSGAAGGKNRRSNNGNNNKMTADVKLSKALSWVLRHAAPSLGLRLSPDGFAPVADVLALDHPRFRNKDGRPKYTEEDVILVVRNNDKQRFRLEYKDCSNAEGSESNGASIGNDRAGDDCSTPQTTNTVSSPGGPEKNAERGNQVLCIRANQGHSLKGVQSDQLLTVLTQEELSRPDLSIIHGTTRKAWEDHIRHEGLSRMTRNHIHFATGLPPAAAKNKHHVHEHKMDSSKTPISGMRSSSEIYIFVDGPRCAADGVPFHRSDNGVILTAGVNEEGMLPVKYFEKVVYALSGKILWKPGDGME